MNTARYDHTATLLPTGQVLVAGGQNGSEYFKSTELYDPTNGTWSSGLDLMVKRGFHTMTLLPSGKILLVGGRIDAANAQQELYDVQWGGCSTGPMIITLYRHTTTLLPSGMVLVTGGYNYSSAPLKTLKYAILYNP